jgi:hypothetical protein
MTNTLFQLIKSLTPGEKRYFKLYAARQSETKKTNYEKLFDEYNELPDNETYNEEKFIKKLRRKNLGKYFSDDKNYLTQLLLKAMRSYASEKKADVQLADMIQEMNFLMLKGLTDHCTRICDRAWEIAEERELTEQKVRLLAIRRLIDRSEYKASRLNYQNDLRMQEEKALAQLADEREVAYLYEGVHNIYLMYEMDEKASEISRINQRLDALYAKPDITFECMNTIIMTKCVILDYRCEYPEALGLIKHLIAKWEQTPWRIKEMTLRYVKLLDILSIFGSRLLLTDEMPPLISKLESIESIEKNVAKLVFYLLSHVKVMNYYLREQFRESLSIIPDIQNGLKEYDLLLNFWQKRLLRSCICVIYLKNKMYKDLLDAVQEVYALSGRDKDKQTRIEDMRIYEFIAHYELGNIELLHYAVRNNQRFFKEREPDNAFLEDLWKLLKQFLQDTDKPKIARQKLKTAIEALVPIPDGNSALKRELILWLDGKNGQ